MKMTKIFELPPPKDLVVNKGINYQPQLVIPTPSGCTPMLFSSRGFIIWIPLPEPGQRRRFPQLRDRRWSETPTRQMGKTGKKLAFLGGFVRFLL